MGRVSLAAPSRSHKHHNRTRNPRQNPNDNPITRVPPDPVEAASDSFGDFAATNDVGGDTNFGDFGESNENGHVGDDNFGDFGGFDAVEVRVKGM